MPYFVDSTLVPRVQKYLESHVDQTYVDIVAMADYLQRTYREYNKRKRSAFRSSVKKAYSVVLQSYGMRQQTFSSEGSSEEGSGPENENENVLNNQLNEMYQRSKQPNKMEDSELIDISSEDSNDVPSEEKTTNGASTSQKLPYSMFHREKNNGLENNVDFEIVPEQSGFNNQRGKKRKLESQSKSLPKKKKSIATLQEPSVTFSDIGGLSKVLEEVCKMLIHVRHPEIYRQLGISPPRGFLLHGPPGSGKTLLANAIAGELGVPLLKVAAPELVAGVSGESEERIRELFERAWFTAPCVLFIDEIDAITPNRQNAQKEMERRIVAQLLSCMDDLGQAETGDRVLVIGATNRPDAIDPALRRAGRFDREVCLGIPDCKARVEILKVLTAKLKLENNFNYETIASYTPGFVGADLMALTREAAMAAVNRVFNDIKEKRKLERALALQKATQELLEKEKILAKQKDNQPTDAEPSEKAKLLTNNEEENGSNKDESNDAIVVIDDDEKQEDKSPNNEQKEKKITEEETKMLQKAIELLTPPQTYLQEMMLWLHEKAPLSTEQLKELSMTMEDFAKALKSVQPSAKREGFATVPDVTWDDVGSLRSIREELQMAILAPVRHEVQFKALGITVPTGVLLCGPPGCGKTLLAKAIANEAGINFISVKGPELLNMYVGESEKAVRLCFERARNSAPCVIFFDELDALCPKRSDTGDGGPTMRVVNQLLTEMDGIEDRKGVFLLAASNRPDIIDPAVLRPGRLDKILYIGIPTAEDRVDILRTITKNGTKPQMSPDVDLEIIGKSEPCEGYTGADLAALVREASVEALKEFMVHNDPQRPLVVSTDHFTRAVAKIRPSISEKDQKHYERLKKVYSVRIPGEQEVEEMEYS
ncbi:uncharacterized AAA domain-containing protein C16E9.10c isoform X2 [Agrilus planipennis]|uniref:Uncharacterized AAA domain-containing protein C16E9.10c isoform X2 n=1 Tax=Agrilus planipennis TaxID=224129 RepID=A0A1W4XSP7_AGRPL|nr:uncharacterized AAA domain-containing protein C16E9.10c isoform X2 [Agrilus planipennis]